MSDTDNDLFNDDGDDGASDNDSGSGKPDESGKKPPESDKRVRDLQSKADQETARANKAEKRLEALLTAAKEPDSDAGKPPERDGNAPVNTDILDMAKMFAFQQNPKLAEFGVEMSDITGDTPGDIARNAAALVARFEKIETVARNKVLAENGLSTEISSGAPDVKKRDFSTMPKKDFDELVEASIRGARLQG